jgi:hypothetical protein
MGRPWNKDIDVLSIGSFPSMSILRKTKDNKHKYGTCSCKENEHHRSLFDFNKEVVSPGLTSKILTPITGYKVCWNAENIWECKLPRALTGLDKRVTFEDLPNIYLVQNVLFQGTYWFRRLIAPDHNSSHKHGRNGVALL